MEKNREKRDGENVERLTPDFPQFCKECDGETPLCPMPYKPEDIVDDERATYDDLGRWCKVIYYDKFNNAPRTFEYTLVCPKHPSEHTVLKVVETPACGFRIVVPADIYDVKRVKRKRNNERK